MGSYIARGAFYIRVPSAASCFLNCLQVVFICLYLDLVRKYVDAADDIVQHLPASAALVTDAEGKAALIWTLGEYGEVHGRLGGFYA